MEFAKLDDRAPIPICMVIGEGTITLSGNTYKCQLRYPVKGNEKYIFALIEGVGQFAINALSIFQDIIESQRGSDENIIIDDSKK